MGPSVAVYQNSIQLYYYDKAMGNLRHGWADSTGWHFENLDGDSGSISKQANDTGLYPTVAVYGDSIQLYYYDKTFGNLRHAWTTSTGWHFEHLDGDANAISRKVNDTGLNPNVLVYGDSLQLYYYDRTGGNLRHAWTTSTGWHFENLDGDAGAISGYNADVGFNVTSTTFENSIQLYYYDRTRGALRHGWADSTGWHFENLGPYVIY
jgi:hypothetical protein